MQLSAMVNRQIFLLCFVLLTIHTVCQARKQQSTVVSDITELKDFKKLLKSKTNILVMFLNAPKAANAVTDIVKEAAKVMKGQATVVIVDCSSSDTKKICKKLKVLPDQPYYLKHYKNGEYHKDYDRSINVSSMTNFLRDPTGDLPWEEDPEAANITHLPDGEALNKFLRKSAAALKKSLILFYAPWCGYCKILKPDYVLAAADLKGEAMLAAIDVSKPGNSKIRLQYNITGFPTILYYEKGNFKFPYDGENKRQAIVDFLKDPTAHLQEKSKKEVKDDSWSSDTDVIHLTTENIDDTLAKAEHAIVVFYAPWCGHCKKIKPEFERAATKVKNEKLNGILAAVDATKQSALAKVFDVKGYPTLKYFHKSEFKYDVGHLRQEDQIVSFMKNPTEPPPPPPPERPWSEEESHVRHLDGSSFRSTLRKFRHAIVMFYAPWCGHCKSTKPEFVKAAENFADELIIAFGAVDCTEQQELCANYDVKGYPTIKYFSYFDKDVQEYSGGRKAPDFISFIHTQMGSASNKQPAPKGKTKSAKDAGFGTNVVIATDDDFETIINSDTPAFIMFYASWCGHCAEIKPAFSKLATSFLTEQEGVKIVAVDAAENPKVADLAQITTLPTFKFYKKGKGTLYEGGRTFDDMSFFCRASKVKDKDEL